MKKRPYWGALNRLLLILFLAGLSLLAGCGNNQAVNSPAGNTPAANSPAGKQAAENKAPILIGVHGAFSGQSADLGIPMRGGIEIAIQEVNAAGGINGRSLEYTAIDDEALPEKAVNAVQKLINRDKVIAIIGGSNSGTTMATSKVSEKSKVVQLGPNGVNKKITSTGNPYMFRVCEVDYDSAEYLVNQALKLYTKPAIVHDNAGFGMGGRDALLAAFKKIGVQPVAVESYPMNASDMTPVVANLKKAGADVVMFWGLGADGALFFKTMNDMNVKLPVYSHDGLFMASAQRLGKQYMEGVIVQSPYDYDNPKAIEVMNAYEKKFGNRPHTQTVTQAYDAVMLLAQALKQTGGEGGDKLRDALESIKEYRGASGKAGVTMSYGPGKRDPFDGDYHNLYQFKGGKWVKIKPAE